MNLFLPSNIGGDAYRIADIARRSKRTAGTLASVLADRLTGLTALAVLGMVFGLLSIGYLEEMGILLIPLIAMMLLVGLIAALCQGRLLQYILSRRPTRRMPRVVTFTQNLIESITQYRSTPKLFSRAMAVSFLFQFNVIVCIFVLSRALSLNIPFLYFCAFIPLISVIEAIPISVFGLGIRDASYVFFFSAAGVAEVDALALAVAYVIVTLVSSLFGGMLLFLRMVRTPMTEAEQSPVPSRRVTDDPIGLQNDCLKGGQHPMR
jgi:glycosyltransferase 2 family protein